MIATYRGEEATPDDLKTMSKASRSKAEASWKVVQDTWKAETTAWDLLNIALGHAQIANRDWTVYRHPEGKSLQQTGPWVDVFGERKPHQKSDNPNDIKKCARFVLDTYSAIAQAAAWYAHTYGILHQDIRLENVLFGDATEKSLDFPPFGPIQFINWTKYKTVPVDEPLSPEDEEEIYNQLKRSNFVAYDTVYFNTDPKTKTHNQVWTEGICGLHKHVVAVQGTLAS